MLDIPGVVCAWWIARSRRGAVAVGERIDEMRAIVRTQRRQLLNRDHANVTPTGLSGGPRRRRGRGRVQSVR